MKANQPDLSQITFTGRWVKKIIDEQPVMYTTNLGAAMALTVTGTTKLKIQMLPLAQPDGAPTMVAVSVNQAPFQRFAVTKTPLVIDGLLPTKTYQIRLVLSGNTDLDEVWFGQQGFAVAGVMTDDGGHVMPSPERGRQITWIGDSITAGCWVAGRRPSEDYRAEANYVAVASQILHTGDWRIAYSAAGLTRMGTGGVPTAFDFLTNIDANTPWKTHSTDLVIINLGTNDRAVTPTEFSTKMAQFIKLVQQTYQTSQIIVVVPFCQAFDEQIRAAVSQLETVQLIETKGWPITFTDQTHPDLAGSQVAGKRMAEALQAKLGADYFRI